MWLCVGCWKKNKESDDICPDCLTPRTAVYCRCGFIFPTWEAYKSHHQSGCVDVGLCELIRTGKKIKPIEEANI